MTRRTFITDLGRATLGVVVAGPALAACSDDAATTDADGSPDGEQAAGGDALRWERASFGFVSAYVVVRGGEGLLFDTGTGEGDPLVAAIEAAGIGTGDVSHVVLSHAHGDHTGGLAVASAFPDATTYAAAPDLDEVAGLAEGGASEVVDGDELLGLRVVATPGHTPGHISLFAPDGGLLLAGDALVNGVTVGGSSGEGIEGSPPQFTADDEAARASVGVLAELAPSTILFGHGEPVEEDAAALLAAYADTL